MLSWKFENGSLARESLQCSVTTNPARSSQLRPRPILVFPPKPLSKKHAWFGVCLGGMFQSAGLYLLQAIAEQPFACKCKITSTKSQVPEYV